MQMKEKPLILIIDDSEINTEFLSEGLSDNYRIKSANNINEIDVKLREERPNLVLLDIIMPEKDGFEVFKEIRNKYNYFDVPVMFISSCDSIDEKIKAFDLGAIDYITKPFNIKEIRARMRKHLWDYNALLNFKDSLIEKEKVINEVCESIFDNFIKLVFIRDKETANHVIRTEKYMYILVKEYVRVYGDDYDIIPEKIARAAALHDIGKIAISDDILLKPGKLTEEEFEIMKNHTSIGKEMLDFKKDAKLNNIIFNYAKDIAYYHHEKYSGGGYPTGIKGEDIPLVSRFMSVVDVYDALVSKRVYKGAMSHKEALNYILNNKNTQFDGKIVDVFKGINEAFFEISKQYKD